MSVIGRGTPRVRAARWAVVVGIVLLTAGCSVLSTLGALGDAGFSVSAVSVDSSGGSSTVRAVVGSPPGVAREVAVEQAQRVVWQTQRTRIDRLELVVDGVETTATRDELTARFGPRDPALDESNVDQVLLIGIFVGLGLVVLAAVGVAVCVTVRRRRRMRVGGPGVDPLWGVTDLLGARTGRFLIDYLVWWVPTVAGMVAVVRFGGAAGPAAFFLAGFGGLLLSAAWAWFTYAFRPARRHDQTLGMRATGLRVVTLDGSPVGLGRHTLRWLLLLVETGFGGLIALLVMALSPRHQRLGDMAAGTIVVRNDPGPIPPSAAPVRRDRAR